MCMGDFLSGRRLGRLIRRGFLRSFGEARLVYFTRCHLSVGMVHTIGLIDLADAVGSIRDLNSGDFGHRIEFAEFGAILSRFPHTAYWSEMVEYVGWVYIANLVSLVGW